MEFHFNFDKPTISSNVGAFFNDNLKTEKEKEFLAQIVAGKKLVYGDANILIKSILCAIIISDGSEENEINIGNQEPEDPLTQRGDPPTQGEHSGSNSKGSSALVLPAATNKNDSVKSDHIKETQKICRFYAQNKCKFGRECRFNHPK